jgi:phosphotransferase system IIB component
MPIKINGTNTAANPSITGDDTDTGIVYGSDQIDFSTGGSSKVTLNGSNLGVGTTTPTTSLHVQQSSVTNAPSRTSALYLENNANCEIQFVGNSSNDCQLRFGTSSNSFKGAIEYELDNNNLEFVTNGSQRMTIDSSGVARIGGTDSYNASDKLTLVGSGNTSLTIDATSTTESSVFFADGSTGDEAYRGYLQYKHADDALVIGTGATERMRVGNSAYVHFGTTATNPTDGGSVLEGPYGHLVLSRSGTGSETMVRFNRAGSIRGSITVSTSTTYNTSSDYRLKENISNLTNGITRLKNIVPKRFNFIDDESKQLIDGFIAHEVSTAVPEAVTGTKDQVELADDDEKEIKKGDPIYQQLDYSKFVPLLTAALKEAIAKIETLETKVAALEAA